MIGCRVDPVERVPLEVNGQTVRASTIDVYRDTAGRVRGTRLSLISAASLQGNVVGRAKFGKDWQDFTGTVHLSEQRKRPELDGTPRFFTLIWCPGLTPARPTWATRVIPRRSR